MGKRGRGEDNSQKSQVIEMSHRPSFLVVKPGEEHTHYDPIIAGWTQSAGNMLPKTPDDILRLFIKGRSLVIVDEQYQPVSHAAATSIYPVKIRRSYNG